MGSLSLQRTHQENLSCLSLLKETRSRREGYGEMGLGLDTVRVVVR